MVLKAYYFKVAGLTRAGRPHDRDIITRRDIQVDAAQRGNLLIADREAAADLAKRYHSNTVPVGVRWLSITIARADLE